MQAAERLRPLLVGVLLAAAAAASAMAAPNGACTQQRYAEADDAVRGLQSWAAAFDFYRRYRGCDEGYVAEGVSERIGRLTADHWESLAELDRLGSRDAGFERWALRHVDSTLRDEDLTAIRKLAKAHCAPSLARLCGRIAHAAKAAQAN
jgi:hypothetical protein